MSRNLDGEFLLTRRGRFRPSPPMAHTDTLNYDQARRNLQANPMGRWPSEAPEGGVWPRPTTSFQLRAADTIFTIGSCFARNIEDHLARLGCKVPMLDFRLPPEEWHGPANGALNKFAPPAFRQAIAWTAAIYDRDGQVRWPDCAPFAIDCGDDAWFDIELAAATPVSRARFVKRRQHIYDIFSQVFAADCLMMTPGLVEAWRDTTTGHYLFGGPKTREMIGLARAGRLVFERLAYPQCFEDMAASIDMVRARNPKAKVVLTTSPVPLAATFTDDDIRVANSYSKSVLRAVCGAMTAERPQVDYFPSFESAMMSPDAEVWDPDRIHVRIAFVGQIVARLLDAYFPDVDRFARLYQQAATDLAAKAFAAAETGAREAVELQPDHRRARILLADALLGCKRPEEALAVLETLRVPQGESEAQGGSKAEAGPKPDDGAALGMRRARALLMLGGRGGEAMAAAIAACDMADARHADFAWSVKHLRRRGRMDEAEAIARAAVTRFPQTVAAYQPLIEILAEDGRDEELITLLRLAVELPLPLPANFDLLAERLGANGGG